MSLIQTLGLCFMRGSGQCDSGHYNILLLLQYVMLYLSCRGQNTVELHFVEIGQARALSRTPAAATNKSNAFRENCPEHFQ